MISSPPLFHAQRCRQRATVASPTDAEFMAVLSACRSRDSAAVADEVIVLFQRKYGADILALARWVAARANRFSTGA